MLVLHEGLLMAQQGGVFAALGAAYAAADCAAESFRGKTQWLEIHSLPKALTSCQYFVLDESSYFSSLSCEHCTLSWRRFRPVSMCSKELWIFGLERGQSIVHGCLVQFETETNVIQNHQLSGFSQEV